MRLITVICNSLLLISFYSAIAGSQTMSDSIVFKRSFGYGSAISIVYTPDSKQVLISTYDGKIRLYDQLTGALVLTYPGTWTNPEITRSVSGNLVAISNYTKPQKISIFEMKTGRLIKEINDTRTVVSFSANDSILLASSVYPGTDRMILIYSDTDSSKYFSLHGNSQISPDGMSALSFALNNVSDSLYWNSFKGPKWSKKYPTYYSDIKFISDSLISLAYKYQNGLLLIKTNNGDTMPRIAKNFLIDAYSFRALHQDNRMVFSSRDTICVWNWEADTLITRLKSTGLNRMLHGFSVDGTQIITKDLLTNTFSCWSAETGDSMGIYVPYALVSYNCINPQLSGDGSKILSIKQYLINYWTNSYSNYIAQLWDANTGDILATFRQYPSISIPRISLDGTTILVAPDMDTVLLFNVNTGKVIRTFHSGFTGISSSTVKKFGVTAEFLNHDSTIFCTFSIDTFPNGSNLKYYNNSIWWNSKTGAIIKQIPRTQRNLIFPQIISSSDCSRYLAITQLSGNGNPQLIRLYNASNDSMIGEAPFSNYIRCASPDLSRILSSNGYVWNYKDNSVSKYFDTTGGTSCQSAAFSPDNSKLLAVYTNRYATQWSTCLQINNKRYDLVTKYAGNGAAVSEHNFSEDGGKVLVNFNSGTPCLYDIAKLSGISVHAKQPNLESQPRLRYLNHRRICFAVPGNGKPSSADAELQIFSLSGQLISRYPLCKSTTGSLQWYSLPVTLSNGVYAYKFTNSGMITRGRFTLGDL